MQSPAMPLQQAIDGAGRNGLLDHLLIRSLDLGNRHPLALGDAGRKGLEEGAFVFQPEVLSTPPAFARGLDGRHSPSFVGRHHLVDGCHRHAYRLGNILSFAGSFQRLSNDLSSPATPVALFPLHPLLDLVLGQMLSCMRDSTSHEVALLVFSRLLSRIGHGMQVGSVSFHTASETRARRSCTGYFLRKSPERMLLHEKCTFILFSASQRHLAWDMRSKKAR